MTKVGDYELFSIETGTFALDGGAMFGVIPKPLWEGRIPADSRNRIRLAMRCLLAVGNNRVILIDNGIGDKFDDKFLDIYGVDHDTSDLDSSLKAAGTSRKEITDVVLTHLHFDHCGGSTFADSAGILRTAFPSARYHVQLDHWRCATAPNPRERGSFLRENLEPLAESGQLSFVEGEVELFPGIFTHTVDGHTEKMQLVRIDGGNRALVFVADLLPTQFHLAPAWTMAYDMRPLVTIEEKAQFLGRAEQNDWSLFFEHDADAEISDLEKDVSGYRVTNIRSLGEL